MIYVTYDEAGNLTGQYVQDLHPDHAVQHIEVSAEQAATWPLYRANAMRDGLELAPPLSPPAPTVPSRVPMLNAHLVLIEAGWMAAIDQFIESMPEPNRSLARAYLIQSLTMARDHELVAAIPDALGKTEAEVDALFIKAGALDV